MCDLYNLVSTHYDLTNLVVMHFCDVNTHVYMPFSPDGLFSPSIFFVTNITYFGSLLANVSVKLCLFNVFNETGEFHLKGS